MVFSSLLFLFRFLPGVLLVYYAVPRPFRNSVLLLASLVFYAWGEPVFAGVMVVSVLMSYAGGILTARFREQGKKRAAKAAMMLSCAVSLSFLAFFKYGDFAIGTVNHLLGADITLMHAALPIGISFYTFQTISYNIDVYRGAAKVQKNPISYGTYVAMFPQLIAGPIVQYKTIDVQLRMRKETAAQFSEGICRFLIGLGKKVLIADQAGALWSSVQVFSCEEIPVLTAWMGLAAYTFQIYFDFSGYSDMAIGLGKMFGFRFAENFNYPYTARSITEFWRRWHISLGTWFREYVYIPLGGNRVSNWRHIRNISVIWLLTGIWHGASWNFAVWGGYYGILLLGEKYIWGKSLKRRSPFFCHTYCMFFVMLGWALFVFDDMRCGLEFMKALFGGYGQGLWNRGTVYLLYNHVILLIICVLGSTRLPRYIANRFCDAAGGRVIWRAAVKNVFLAGILILSVAWLVDASFQPFLYFRF